MVTGILRVFHFDVYAFLDLRDTLSFLTQYIAVNFDIRQETFWQPFLVSFGFGDPILTRREVKNNPIIFSQKIISADLVAFEIVEFDMILGMDF